MIKKIFTAALAAAVAVAITLPVSYRTAQAESKSADVYILAGQSNAVGCSNLGQTVYGGEGTYRDLLKADDARNQSGYENVLYYGAVNMPASETTLPDPALQTVKMDLGQSLGFSGPELGMAKILSKTATEDNPAVIIKFAASGSHMGDYNGKGGGPYAPGGTRFTDYFGNWAAPSTIARWKEEKEASGKDKKIHRNTGILYTRLVDFVKQGLEKLESEGYSPTVKGYIWMQGESDSEDKQLAINYKENVTEFIGDLRKDVAKIANDADAEFRPFVFGKITPTYNMGTAKGISEIRRGQNDVDKTLPRVYAVETEDLPVFDVKNQETCGSDICHFNGKDIYTLGQRFAQTALDKTVKYVYAVSAGEGGTVAQKEYLSNGESVTIEYTADEGYTLSKVLVSGTDVTTTAVNGTISLTPTNTDKFYQKVTFEFEEAKSTFPAWGIALICLGIAAVGAVSAVLAIELTKKKKAPSAQESPEPPAEEENEEIDKAE